MNMRRILLFLLLSLSLASLAQPRTPLVMINNKFRLVELAKSQRATLTYDLRSIRGEHLKVDIYRHNQKSGEKPIQEWLFHGSQGSERVSFKELPLSVYTLVCYACNEEGQALASAAPYIHVQYGGWRAWEDFKPPVADTSKKPEGFEDVSPATDIRNRDARIGLSPPAVVIKPGQSVTFSPVFHGIEKEPISWSVVGEGKLKAIEDGKYVYTAPSKQLGTKLFRVEIQSSAHPDLIGTATVLVTTANQEDIQP